MSGDLEDFLKRAAQRRQANQAKPPVAVVPVQPPRPEYTDHRAERLTSRDREDDIPMAVVVVEEEDAYSMQRRRIAQAKAVAEKAEGETAARLVKIQQAAASGTLQAMPRFTGNVTADLIQLLRSPAGICQAVLLREILDRPDHRW